MKAIRQSSTVNRRCVVVRAVLVVMLAFGMLAAPRAEAPNVPAPIAVWNRQPLTENSLALLPLGSIKPRGWLERQLEIQASGLTGHLHELWPDVGPNSGWLGGTGESWERGPYFLDGLVPLAWLLDDARLKETARKFVDWTLDHQTEDGWIGPRKNTDWWPNMVMLKVLTQYYEVTGDPRVLPALKKYFALHLASGRTRPLKEWAVYRWADELVSVLWLYNRTGDPALLDLARMLHDQGQDWKKHFAAFEFTSKTSEEQLGLKGFSGGSLPDRAMRAHGVNNAMALKTSAVWSLVSHDESDRKAVYQALDVLDRYHGLPNGMFSGTEHYAGHDPSQGIELCAVVEALYSLQQVVAANGDTALADRIERIAFNAMPATFSSDMWAHQYNQQPNQVRCTLEKRDWVSNGPESNLFAVEPNFGCCTANMHQGWPKLVQSLWMATRHGLSAMVYAPSEVRTIVNGVPVTIVEDTDYPFKDTVTFTVTPDRPVRFALSLRIPSWAAGATLSRNGRPAQLTGASTGLDVTWHAGDKVVLRLPMKPRLSTWERGAVAVERGPLVFSLRLDEQWTPITQGMKHPAPAPAKDWEVTSRSPWNYGLVAAADASGLRVEEKPVGDFPFSPLGAPVEIHATGRRIPSWTLVNGSAGPLPQSPVTTSEPEEPITLVPYGAAKLRVTVFPRLER
jgi:DUF1680 family protein